YDPTIGAFISKDPIKADGELSAYAYCAGDPVGRVDPSGLTYVAVPFAGAAAVQAAGWVFLTAAATVGVGTCIHMAQRGWNNKKQTNRGNRSRTNAEQKQEGTRRSILQKGGKKGVRPSPGGLRTLVLLPAPRNNNQMGPFLPGMGPRPNPIRMNLQRR
ncbi:MAG: RHS repeat-associated core domain-containing protein, partial [Coriobacteriia bacterium]|nr:RHS repeat-associated core domain-containing protein [Coriobacteriia bacterium]